MRRWSTFVAVGLVLSLAPVAIMAQEHHGKKSKESASENTSKLPKCPVTGEEIDFSVKTMTDDGPVYFCCPSCIKKFEKSPADFKEQVAAQRAALAKMDRVQVSCPVSGESIDGKTKAEVDGKTVYFCCKDCVAKYEKDPKQYHAALEASYTYQTKCPVSDEEIDPTKYVDLPTGERIYLCCADCKSKVLNDPATFAPKLAKQGIHIDVKKLEEAKKAGKP